jgi:hypothetical protein
MPDVSEIVLALSASASIAVVITAVLVVLQLRQNSRLLEHAAKEYRANVAFGIFERLTDESFARRRKAMHDASRFLAEKGPSSFDDSLADLEARNFAYIYQILGALVRAQVIDEDLVVRALGRLITTDWTQFEPISKHLQQRYGFKVGTWVDFEWLAGRTREFVARRESAAP